MQNNGKLLIIGILAVAIAAAGFAWWFQFSRGQRALGYWGGDDAAVIRHGTSTELFEIAREGNGESFRVGDEDYVILRQVSIGSAPGIVHARHALIDDASYQWEVTPPEHVVWTHAVQFDNQEGRVVWVVIDLENGVLRPLEGDRPLLTSEKLQSGLKEFFAEQLPATESDE